MDKQVILAVAGAGKTYSICHKVDINKRSLILAFTNQNIKNIKKEIISSDLTVNNYEIPKNIKIMTFHSFIYNMILLPYFPSYAKEFNSESFKIAGITLQNPPQQSFKVNGKRIPNARYSSVDKLQHYFNGKYLYCSLMSRFCLEKITVLKRAIKNLKLFYDEIYIDEFQDFRKDDYKLINLISEDFKNITLVGDYYQHSVSGKNNSGIPFKNHKKVNLNYDQYISLLENLHYHIDVQTLSKSRRCSNDVCDFISEKLGIEITSCNINKGKVIWVTKSNISEILDDDNIIKVLEKIPYKYSFKAVGWGYSKGDTYDNTCVILTGKFADLDSVDFKYDGSNIEKNKLYVALTRTKGNLYILKKELFDEYKDQYLYT